MLSAMSSAVLFRSTDSTGYTSDIIATPVDDDEERCRGGSSRGAAVNGFF